MVSSNSNQHDFVMLQATIKRGWKIPENGGLYSLYLEISYQTLLPSGKHTKNDGKSPCLMGK